MLIIDRYFILIKLIIKLKYYLKFIKNNFKI